MITRKWTGIHKPGSHKSDARLLRLWHTNAETVLKGSAQQVMPSGKNMPREALQRFAMKCCFCLNATQSLRKLCRIANVRMTLFRFVSFRFLGFRFISFPVHTGSWRWRFVSFPEQSGSFQFRFLSFLLFSVLGSFRFRFFSFPPLFVSFRFGSFRFRFFPVRAFSVSFCFGSSVSFRFPCLPGSLEANNSEHWSASEAAGRPQEGLRARRKGRGCWNLPRGFPAAFPGPF